MKRNRVGVSSAVVACRYVGICLMSVCTVACGDSGQWPSGNAGEENASPDGDGNTIAQVGQAVTSGNWLVASGGVGLNTVTADSQIGTDSGSNFAISLVTHGTRGLRVAPTSIGVPNLIGGYSGNVVTTGANAVVIAGGGASAHVNTVSDDYGVVGGGWQNQAGNGTTPTTDASYATVGGGNGNAARGQYSFVGGGSGNTAGDPNDTSRGLNATVGGGQGNTARGQYSFVGGGSGNIAGSTTFGDDYNTAGGGFQNQATGGASTIAGGDRNVASGYAAAIGGGAFNTASATYATVPGGLSNTASGLYSFAAGQLANADFDGCFVWSDRSSPSAGVNCGAANKFVARAAGGVVFYTNSTATAGVKLTPGAQTWTMVSDRNAKSDFARVDPGTVLKRVAAMPVSEWTYKSEPGVRHMGPMAQDFHAAFGLGTEDRTITEVDAFGVTFAAVQGLNEKVTKLEADLAIERASNDALKKRLDRLEAGAPRALAGVLPSSPWSIVVLGLGLAFVIRSRHERKRSSA